MPINKQHKEFYAVDMGGEWVVPEGYPEGIKQKILVGHLDEETRPAAGRACSSSSPAYTQRPLLPTTTGKKCISLKAT